MANFKDFPVFFFICSLCLFSLGLLSVEVTENRKVYIAYMGAKTKEYSLSSVHHVGILQEVIEDSTPEKFLVRSYGRSFNGFAANLTEKESEKLKGMKGVVSVFPSRTLKLQTTRSWDFIGLPENAGEWNTAESDIIVGVIDAGVWPESPSFSDDGFGPPPKKWKGVCAGGKNFTCNNKVIGARAYSYESARDEIGHGTHTASIVAGRKVDDVSFFGLAQGNARGGVPFARVAVYKACGSDEACLASDLMAAFDDAIADGVDLISISVGSTPSYFDLDVIAIGGFHAMEKGILTVQSAGNGGNDTIPVLSTAPWLFTVGASSTDRRILDKLVLGNGKTLMGNSINSFASRSGKFPLAYGKQVMSNTCSGDLVAEICEWNCLNTTLVRGKIVFCGMISGILEALRAGALGVVIPDMPIPGQIGDVSSIVPMRGIGLSSHDIDALFSYMHSTKSPVGNILKSESINDTNAPLVVSFSSRGPNSVAPDILKPDITAPGVEILAAYSPVGPISEYVEDKRKTEYNVISGTSVSCPHAAGAAAYVKSLHPDWSPSAIKSALMTTARPMSPSKNLEKEFAYGSGFIDPVKATNPGLVYETTKDDYIRFLCNMNYTEDRVRLVSGDKTATCPDKIVENLSPKDVNYPSMSAKIAEGKPFSVKFNRTVTNIGVSNSTYVAKIDSDLKLKVTVEPKSLSFESLNEQKSFQVTVVSEGLTGKLPFSASLVWSDGIHSVRSPIVIYTDTFRS